MRLRKRLSVTVVAGLMAAGAVGVQAASAAQNYAPRCSGSAAITDRAEYQLTFSFKCTTYSSTVVSSSAGGNNQGDWTAQAYDTGAYVKYSDGKWYRAAVDATASDEPTKPVNDDEGNPVTVWVEQTAEAAYTWGADKKDSTSTAGSYVAGAVVKYSGSYYKANAVTAATDVPGSSAKWDALSVSPASVYGGPQPAGLNNVTKTVSYPGWVSGWSAVLLDSMNEIASLDSEPPVTLDDGSPAPNQTQSCNGVVPGVGIGCFLTTSVDVYAKKDSDSSYTKVNGNSLYLKSGSANPDVAANYSKLKDGFYAKLASGSSVDADFLSIGTLGMPTNSKKILPALSGSKINGVFDYADDPCTWTENGTRIAITVADPEGQVAVPFEINAASRYFTLRARTKEKLYMPKGCQFRVGTQTVKVYTDDAYGIPQRVKPLGKKGLTYTADGDPYVAAPDTTPGT